MLLEVCIDSVQGAAAAELARAHRVELCSGLVEGGITPSYGLIRQARRALHQIKLMVIIRPRGGDFLYSDDEMRVMLDDIAACKQLGADGVVLGCLSSDGSVDMEKTGRLVLSSKEQALDVTFHRAFDMSSDLSAALEALIRLGVPRVLTSGGAPTAKQGAAVIRRLVEQAAGRISIMAGGGVRSSNCRELAAATGVVELHSSARRALPSAMVFRPANGLSMCATVAPSDWEKHATSSEEIRLIMDAVSQVPNTKE